MVTEMGLTEKFFAVRLCSLKADNLSPYGIQYFVLGMMGVMIIMVYEGGKMISSDDLDVMFCLQKINN